MHTAKFNAGRWRGRGRDKFCDGLGSHSAVGGEIPLATLYYRNQDKLWRYRKLASHRLSFLLAHVETSSFDHLLPIICTCSDVDFCLNFVVFLQRFCKAASLGDVTFE